MNVVIGTKTAKIAAADLLGTGGEGSVYRYGTSNVIKIYHAPDKHSDKLSAFLNQRPADPDNRMVLPARQVWNERHEQVIGYVAPRVGLGFEDVRELSKRKYRKANNITTQRVALLFQDAVRTVQRIHEAGFVIGDFSDLNEKFQGSTMLFLDTDSWQFGKYPCPVATEQFIDPRLYKIDLSLAPVFVPNDDWYSFAVLLFKSMLGVHPYGGTYRGVDSLQERASQRIPVLEQGVTYPSVGEHPDLISDALKQAFWNVFKLGQRGPFTASELTNDYVLCPHCGATYPSQRRACPVCSTVTPAVTIAKGVIAVSYLKALGGILMSKMVGGKLYVVTTEPVARGAALDEAFLRTDKTVVWLGPYHPGARYDVLDGQAVAVDGNELLLAGQRYPTDTFRQKAMFRTNGRFLFRLVNGLLVAGEMRNGVYVETTLRHIMPEQTWFAVSPDADVKHTLCGFFQVFREQVWWASFEGRWVDPLALTNLAQDEVQVDVLVRFGSQSILIMRQTVQAGVDYVHSAIVDSTGRMVRQDRVKGDALPHGCVYQHGTLLMPTDEGLVQVRDGATKTFTQTKGVIEAGDTLYAYQDGLLVVKQDRVNFVQLS